MEEYTHIPVLLSEVLAYLNPQSGESYLDLTAGFGGHAKSILDVTRNYKSSVLIDRDSDATSYLKAKFAGTGVGIVNASFYRSVPQLLQCGDTFDIILADFGVSSPQLDIEERGFSFKTEGPLDMRMDRSQRLTADEIINGWDEYDLANIIQRYGEETPGRADMLARLIVHHRPLDNTKELGDLIKAHSPHTRVHPATKVFQAVRIVVNNELEEIERTLPLLPQLLKKGGRIGLITFHSLEDRLVKDFFKTASNLGEESPLSILTKKPIVAESQELVINPRARSAKLRVAVRN